MAVLSRTQIEAADDQPREVVPIPEWGGDVLVRGVTSAEWDAFDAWCSQQGDVPREVRYRNVTARLVMFGLINESGTRLYADHEVELLGKRGAKPLRRIYDVINRLTGKSAEAQEAVEKKSEPAPSSSSG